MHEVRGASASKVQRVCGAAAPEGAGEYTVFFQRVVAPRGFVCALGSLPRMTLYNSLNVCYSDPFWGANIYLHIGWYFSPKAVGHALEREI